MAWHWVRSLGVLGLMGLSSLAIAAGPAPGASAALSSFAGETDLQSYLQQVLVARQQREAKLKAEREAWAKAHPPTTGSIAGNTAAGTKVTVANAASGFLREVTADQNGNYRVGSLPNGTYEVTANGQTQTVMVIEPMASNSSLASVSVQGTAASASDRITNVQTEGVDEGGIVKKAGDYLVVLRRGRLFSLRADARELRLVSSANAYGPDIDGSAAWYDEMLISGRTIVVVGYSDRRAGTEIGLFDLGADGRIAYRATYHLYSNDYFSSRDYASRLVGDTLVFYSPIDLYSWGATKPNLPGVRRWTGKEGAFQRIAAARDVYRSRIHEESLDQTLHSITRCRIGDGRLDCTSTAVIGPGASAFYVSRDAVFLWMVSSDEGAYDRAADASVVRLPLDGTAPSALRVQGSPIDQLSFLEQDGYLNVLVGAQAQGLRMWSAYRRSGGLALLRVPIHRFGDADASSAPADYRSLPSGPSEFGYWNLANRYVGPWLLYGGGGEEVPAVAVRIDRRGTPLQFDLGHGVERIEAMGDDAVFVGSRNGGLQLSSLALGANPRIASTFLLRGAAQAEDRTHGYFYKALGTRQGMFGLPVVTGEWENLKASVQFVRNSNLRLGGIGVLRARLGVRQGDEDDGCVASCEDWYGDARPIFIGDRVYALLGYELVEGTLDGGRIRELRRIDFTPAAGK